MCKTLITSLFLFFTFTAFSQSTLQVKKDTVTVKKAEFAIENKTSDTLGFLYNTGKGRTQFKRLELVNLAKTKFCFLDYMDLIYTNSLFEKLDKIEQKRIDRKPIPNWYYYQIEEKELTREDFLFFFTNVNASELVFLITDEGHDNGWVFRFYINEFMSFSKWYEEYFNRDFFQFSDYLVVFPSLNRIRVIDDEGGINEIEV